MRRPLALGALERVQSPSNRLPVDAELIGKVGLVLAGTNAAGALTWRFSRCRRVGYPVLIRPHHVFGGWRKRVAHGPAGGA